MTNRLWEKVEVNRLDSQNYNAVADEYFGAVEELKAVKLSAMAGWKSIEEGARTRAYVNFGIGYFPNVSLAVGDYT